MVNLFHHKNAEMQRVLLYFIKVCGIRIICFVVQVLCNTVKYFE
jgi:hypothetical protein